jgi:hypothetical protein
VLLRLISTLLGCADAGAGEAVEFIELSQRWFPVAAVAN